MIVHPLLTVAKLGLQDPDSRCGRTLLEVVTFTSKAQKMKATEDIGSAYGLEVNE